MDDREKVIKGFTCCDGAAVHLGHCQEDCPYFGESERADKCVEKLHSDALSLLKAREPKKVRCVRRLTKVMKGVCPACKMEIESVIHGRLTKFCKFCSQAVKWDE